MSTKTTFKRIALVAVASMGFGMLSVAPSFAGAGDITMTYDFTATGSTATPTVGSAVVIPVTLATSSITSDASGATATLTATLTTKPTNSALDTESATTSSVSLNAFPEAEATMAVTASTASVGAKLTATYVGDDLTQSATVVGSFGFTPDTAGTYVMTLAVADTNATAGGTNTSAITTTTVEITVKGASLVQAASGLGTAAGTQTVGSQSAVAISLPAASTTTSVYQISATGASIVGVFRATTTDAANANSFTSTTGIVKNDGTSFAGGVTYTGQVTVTGVVGSSNVADQLIVQLTSATAGAATVFVKSANPTTGVLTTTASAVVEYGAAAAVSTSLSTVFIGQGNARPSTVETAAIRVPSTAGVALSSTTTTGATIAVDVKDATGAALVNQAITATITGSGLITLASGTGTGSTGTVRTASLSATTMANASQAVIGVSADGTRGVGTITITAGGVTIATKTVTFYGAVATLTATQGVKVMRSGRTAASTEADFTLGGVDPAQAAATAITRTTATNISIVAKDVDGNVVPLAAAPTAVISDALVVGAVNIASCAGGASTSVCAAGAGNYIANTVSAIGGVSGAAATVTFQTPHPTVAGTYISTAALPFTLGGTALGGTVTMTLNKATYEPGERMIITYTAKDAAGNPVRDWTTAATPTANKNVPGLAGGTFVAGSVIIGDEAGELVYAPVSPGAFIITLATGTATGAEITATATVSDDAATAAGSAAADAAAEATDAANAATDAANAAAEAADAATAAAQDAADAVAALSASVSAMVSDLKKQITALTNLVIKIQKKVRA
jgi:trimeric autotransporter adhesin